MHDSNSTYSKVESDLGALGRNVGVEALFGVRVQIVCQCCGGDETDQRGNQGQQLNHSIHHGWSGRMCERAVRGSSWRMIKSELHFRTRDKAWRSTLDTKGAASVQGFLCSFFARHNIDIQSRAVHQSATPMHGSRL